MNLGFLDVVEGRTGNAPEKPAADCALQQQVRAAGQSIAFRGNLWQEFVYKVNPFAADWRDYTAKSFVFMKWEPGDKHCDNEVEFFYAG